MFRRATATVRGVGHPGEQCLSCTVEPTLDIHAKDRCNHPRNRLPEGPVSFPLIVKSLPLRLCSLAMIVHAFERLFHLFLLRRRCPDRLHYANEKFLSFSIAT